MSKLDKGYVYILTNPSFKDDWVKIGKSSRAVNVRSKELDNTAVPLPFSIYATLKTAKYNEAEKFIHKMIDLVAPDIRIRKGREFFNVLPRKAFEILQLCADQYDDSEIEIHDEELLVEVNALVESTSDKITLRREPLTFEMLGIPVGSELTFVEQPGMVAIVVDRVNTVRIDDLELSLSAAVRELKHKFGTMTPSDTYQGGLYFEYNGEKLTDIRKRLGR
jgi:hypothetical protein